MKKILTSLLLVSVLALFGCGGGGDTTGGTDGTGGTIGGNGTPFTNAAIAGKTFQFALTFTGATSTFNPSATFNADGSAIWNGAAAAWVIDSAGKLTVSVPTTGLNVDILVASGTVGTVTNVQVHQTQASPAINSLLQGTMTLADGSVGPAAFTSAMLAGKTGTHTLASDTNVFTFAATGNVVTVATATGPVAGSFAINSNGTLTLTFPTDTLTFTITSQSGNTLTVTLVRASSPSVIEGPATFTII